MNANEIYEYAQDAFSLIRKTDDATSTAALEIAKAGALVSIADSLREMVAIQRENQKRADDINTYLEGTCDRLNRYASRFTFTGVE